MSIHALELLMSGAIGCLIGTAAMMINYGALNRLMNKED